MKTGTLSEIAPARGPWDTDKTPLFPHPSGCDRKLGWLNCRDIVMVVEVTDDSDDKRVRVLSRLGIGWISKKWLQEV